MTSTYNPGRRNALKKSAGLMGLATLSNAGMHNLATADEPASKPESKYGIEGYEAPELDIDYWIDENGKPSSFSVAENKGKWTFLKCFQNWCPGCHASGFPTLQAVAREFHDNPKVAIAAIQTVFEGFDTNTEDTVRDLQLRYDLPITMGHDPGDPDGLKLSDTMLKYRTGGTPWLILINPEGVVEFNDFKADTAKLTKFLYDQVG